MSDDQRKSWRDFDYFGGGAPADDAVVEDDGMASEAAAPERALRRFAFTVVTATAFFVVSAWVLWGYRDSIAYAFASPRPPQELGDVVELSPADIAHNSFVSLQGITEHRGFSQKIVRGILPWREEYWYFRLLGSRGVFVETQPDRERYGFAMALDIRGRAIDPKRAEIYSSLLREYREKFPTTSSEEVRIIQVGVEPGQGRLGFLGFFALVALLGALDVLSIATFWRARRRIATPASPTPRAAGKS